MGCGCNSSEKETQTKKISKDQQFIIDSIVEIDRLDRLTDTVKAPNQSNKRFDTVVNTNIITE